VSVVQDRTLNTCHDTPGLNFRSRIAWFASPGGAFVHASFT